MSRSPAEPRGRGLGPPTLAAVLATLIVAACTATPSPTRTSPAATGSSIASPSAQGTPPSPSASDLPATPSPSPTPDFSGLPALLVARVGATGSTLWETVPGHPEARTPLVGPAGQWRVDAASAAGHRVAFTALSGPAALMTAVLSGTTLVAGPRRVLPTGLLGDDPRNGFVSCVSEGGDLMVVDEAAALHLVSASGRVGSILPASTLGACGWSGSDAVLFDVDGSHHLGLWQIGAPKVAMSDLKLTWPSAAGGTVAALSNDGLAGRAVVLSFPDAPGSGTFQPTVVATLRPAEGEAYAGVRLSADGRWLVAWGGIEGEAPAWLDAYRAAGSDYVLVGRTAFRGDEDVRAVVAP